MKNFKNFIVEMAEEMLDAEVSFYPDSVKYDKTGNVTSYKLKITFEDERTSIVMKDKALERAFISYYGDAKLKKMFAANSRAAVLHTEVYSSIVSGRMDMYIYLGNKKVSIKV